MLFLAILIFTTISCDSESDPGDSQFDATLNEVNQYDVKVSGKQTVVIFDVVNGVVAGTSTLHRNKSGITVNFKATGLIADHAYTVWWVIWNNPEECAIPGACSDGDFGNPDVQVELMYATGHVVGNNGKGNFGAHLNENDASETINPLFGIPSYGGLADAQKAEVHIVLRSHGPKIPGIVNEQIGSYLGGCSQVFPYGFPPFTEIPDEPGECGDIYASVHRVD